MSEWIQEKVDGARDELRKAADQALVELQEGSRDVAPMEWFWLAVLLTISAGSWYIMMLGAGQQTGLW